MDAKQLFFERYHGFQDYPALLVDGMTDQQLRERPHPNLNPIIWILWHTARCEDVGINRLIADHEQVLDDGDWSSRLGVTLREIGTGMTKPEVDELASRINLPELLAYRTAVTERTEQVVTGLPPDELMVELTPERLHQVLVEEGAVSAAGEWLPDAYRGHTKGWVLGHMALTHNYYHIGQAFTARKMYGVPTPW